jgi:tetraacyldisaccharide 4'-kinase
MKLAWPIRVAMLPLSWMYRIAVQCKAAFYAKGWCRASRLRGAVVSVGNLTVGGTGKTPTVLWLAEKFLNEGKTVAILSRGYRGERGSSDELELLKDRLGDRVRFGVGPDRFARGQKLEAISPVDIFLLDDGFQHQKLARDVNLLLVDATTPLHQEQLLPAGRLREPMSAVARADLVLFTRTGTQSAVKTAIQKFPHMPIFPVTTRLKGYRKLDSGDSDATEPGPSPPQPVFALCGIGNPEAFFHDVQSWGNLLAGQKAFRDHHKFQEADVANVQQLAAKVGAKSILMTAKDAVNLGGRSFSALPVYVCEIDFSVGDEATVWKLIQDTLAKRAEAQP